MWSEALTEIQMKNITAGIRTELGGVPYNEETAIEPIRDLKAYYLRFLMDLRPPQSINIFADFDGNEVPDLSLIHI